MGFAPAAAAAALRVIRPTTSDVKHALIQCLGHDEELVRSTAGICTLIAIDPTMDDLVEVLTESVDCCDWDIRQAAAVALGKLGPVAKTAIPALVKALQDEESAVRAAAAFSITQIEGVDQVMQIGPQDAAMRERAAVWLKHLQFCYLVGRLHYKEGAISLNEAARRLQKREAAGEPHDKLPSSAMQIGRILKKNKRFRLFFFADLLQIETFRFTEDTYDRDGLSTQFTTECHTAWIWTGEYLRTMIDVGPSWFGFSSSALTLPER